MKVLIVGCGFAGLEVAKELRKRSKELEIAMIDRRTRFEYLAALPEILSAKVSPAELSADLNNFAASIDAEFINEEIITIDFTAKIVKTGTAEMEISYDYIVLSVGAEQTFFGIHGAEEHSYSVNTLEGARSTKETLDTLDHAKKVNVAVIGAGLTGVEVAGELANSVRKNLSGRGVEILTETAVQEVGDDAILFVGGAKRPYDIIIWTAGIKPNTLLQKLNLPKEKGWIKVDSDLRVAGQEAIFAIGDTAYFESDSGRSGQNVEEAEGQGKVAAENIVRAIKGERLKSYRPKNTIQNPRALISLGDDKAVIYFAGKVVTVGAYLLKKFVEHRYMRRFR
jgi:NADH dehydrogenase